VSCTGYTTPGLDILLARDLGMAASVLRLSIGHMGCYAALSALAAVNDFVVARQRPAVLLCCELTSLHVQPPASPTPGERLSYEEMQQVVAHALFADAAAAAVVPEDTGLQVVDVIARTDVTASDHMTWDITDLGFRMGLSPRVPDVLARHVGSVIGELLTRHRQTVSDIAAAQRLHVAWRELNATLHDRPYEVAVYGSTRMGRGGGVPRTPAKRSQGCPCRSRNTRPSGAPAPRP
jgi:predicted naringenin-chalcone synthase